MTIRADGPSLAELAWFETVVNGREGGARGDQRLEMLVRRRAESPERSARLDQMLLGELERRDQGLREASANLDKLKEIIDKLTDPPWHTGIYLGAVQTDQGLRPMVQFGSARHVVNLGEAVSLDKFLPGDEVFLNHDLTALTRRSPFGVPQVGETAVFDRLTEDGRLVVQSRDEELILSAAGVLDARSLKSGDLVRWDKGSWMAYERVERAGRPALLPRRGARRPAGAGRRAAGQLADAAGGAEGEAGCAGAGAAVRLGGPGDDPDDRPARLRQDVVGPRGGGGDRTDQRQEVPFRGGQAGPVGGSLRGGHPAQHPRLLRGAPRSGPGRVRGLVLGRNRNRRPAPRRVGQSSRRQVSGALLAELDGFAGRESVAIIAASNRKDLVDPALLQRLSGIEIAVSRPDRRGAKEIFGIHLNPSIPYNPDGEAAVETREEIIDRGVSQLYSPNGENELCTLRFRDGMTRVVAARELASGRVIEQICRDARRSAFQRHVDGGEQGLTVDDMSEAVSAAIERMATTLTPGNAHSYLFDLPQDVDVVAVDAAARPAGRSHRYLHRN